MDLNSYLFFALLPLCLAVLLSLLLVRGESCGAMTTADPGDDIASLMAKTIAKFKTHCRGKKKKTEGWSWPQGVYGLPMPTSGCPTDSGFDWNTGSRFQDRGTAMLLNQGSAGNHFKGPYTLDDMWQHFCMKTVDRVADTDPVWPSGQYCLFKYGQNCPNGMSSGYVFWDDENIGNTNSVNGTVPSGVYDQNTLIHFCCMTDGNASVPITLPSHSPFYLFPYTSRCQKVQGMNDTREWFQWGVDGPGYHNGSHPFGEFYSVVTQLYFCYYNKI